MNRTSKVVFALTAALLAAGAPVPAAQRGGGSANVRSSSSSSVNRNTNVNANKNVNANVNRNTNVNTNVNRNYNSNTNVNVNRNTNVHVDVDHHYGYGGGCCYHPAATVAAVAVTAAVIGSIVYSVPPSCQTVYVNGVTYSQCGSTWYQPQFVGTSTTYIVVAAPR